MSYDSDFEPMENDDFFDMEDGIRVNMTDQEANSESRDNKPIPRGKYLCAITDVEVAKVANPPKPGKKDNRGKPYFKMELTIQDGDYAGRKLYTNVMLFEGALYSATQMLKALGVIFNGSNFQVEGYGQNTIPSGSWWMGKEMVVQTVVKRGQLIDKSDPEGGRYADRGEPNGFWHADTWKGAPVGSGKASSGGDSLMP